jgi:hypothetical protein
MTTASLPRGVKEAAPLPLNGGSRMAATSAPSPHQNHLIDALPASDYERVASHLQLIPMNLGDVLYESGAELHYVYFPTTCIISLLYVMEDGASAEIAVVGNEGILGISLFMGAIPRPAAASCKARGTLSDSRPTCSSMSSSATVLRYPLPEQEFRCARVGPDR